MGNIEHLKMLVYGSYVLTLAVVYVLITAMHYMNKGSQAKILGFTLDTKNAAKNREKVKELISVATREQQEAFLWPVFLIKRASAYVKEKFKKEE